MQPGLGYLLILLGIIALIWLILTVEYNPKYSKFQIVLAIILLAFLLGFGIQIVLVSLGL
ncbi:MAG: hypothetical protein KIH08_02350 [Candidatus Freyarchaeota archaeon]|nr:hypothetical protein [Candidatus Jordarchaeia archaeon]MBS7268549.1 hypothetical protein [Candidatus Jordarchaeia archaeon]MBS7279267.1 hypothetical protein [Candidatus Jordarchaeia archaeon]